MKDIINSQNKIANDMHLKNIFINESYLELGIIDVDVIKRLLNYELININDITYFPVQNKGLGHSNLSDQSLRNYLPYYFFRRLAENNSSFQLCITYGLLQYTNIDRKETFMPIILIPIFIYYENNEVLVQMISSPVINPMINSVFSSAKISFIQSIDLNDILTLDYTLSQIEKINDVGVRLDNYLTYAQLNEKDIILSYKPNIINRLINYKIEKNEKLKNGLIKGKTNVYSNMVLNKTQKEVLDRLVDGESLSITGYNGTGKTTVLKSFLINNLANNKKTLYISNSSESITNISNFLDQLMLTNYVVNLTDSFKKINFNLVTESYFDPTDDITPLIKQLHGYYKYLNEYESLMNKSIYDFNFMDIIRCNYLVDVKNASNISDKWMNSEDFKNIYKHEYEEIYSVLLAMEVSFQKIKSFQNSIWKEIPIINNISHVNQVINVVFQLNTGLKKLREFEIALGNYGVKSILSFSEMKKCINPMDKLSESLLPDEWKKSLSLYKEAKSKYVDLKNDIYNFQEAEYYLSTKYKNLSNLNIETEIKLIYGDFYQRSDETDLIIEDLLNNKKEIKRIINLTSIDLRDFASVTSLICEFFNWEFMEKDEYINEIMHLIKLFDDNYFSGKMITSILNNKLESDKAELNSLNKNILTLNEELKGLEKKNPRLAHLDFDKGNVEYENELYRTYDVKRKKLKKFIRDYHDICGYGYEQHEINIKSFDVLKDYYDLIRQKKYRKIIVDYLQSLDENKYIESIANFKIFMKAYENILDSINYFSAYHVSFADLSIKDKINKLTLYINYLISLYESNKLMTNVIISNDLEYVKPSDYFKVKKNLDDFNLIISNLKTNTEYKRMFGYLYQAEETNVLNIMKIIQMYDAYINVFVSEEKIYDSFTNYSSLKEVVNKVVYLVNEIGENLRLYSLIFKDSVSRYYFSNIEANVAYLSKLLDAKEELTIYLSITHGIGVLNDYKLYNLIKYIEENDEIKGIASKFSLVYFEGLIKEYLDKYPDVYKSKEYIETLNKTIILEDVICKQKGIKYVNDILKNLTIDAKRRKIRNFDYQEFFNINRNRLRIYLTNKNVITNNSCYRYFDYDTVIVDDAHMLTTGDFNNIFKGKQVVICGDYQSNKIVNQNLISLATSMDTITFKHRFLLGPRQLTNNMPSVTAPHHKLYKDNFGIKVIEKGLDDYIYNLYMEDCHVKINYFIKDINRQKEAYENLCKSMYKKNVNVEDITAFINNNICICDINVRNYTTSDYNILFLKDYCFEDSQIVASNLFEILMLAKNELIIYDSENYLLKSIELDFFKMIKKLVVNDVSFKGVELDNISKAIKNDLIEKGYEVYFGGNNINMIIKKKDSEELVSLFILYSNGNGSEVLNIYRDFYDQYIKNGHKVIVKTMVDLLKGRDKFVNELCEELNG